MNKVNYIIVLILLVNNPFTAKAQILTQKINAGWQFRQQNKNWYPAKVPGEVHVDLLSNKLIPDPFYRDNEKKLQWIEKENWEYRTVFNASAAVLNKKQINLVFDGLDTYADVYLNGKLLLSADNMFRQWHIDVRSRFRSVGNELLVRFIRPKIK
jgi:beta-mannosidase